MKKRNVKKLEVAKETLRTLDLRDAAVQAGQYKPRDPFGSVDRVHFFDDSLGTTHRLGRMQTRRPVQLSHGTNRSRLAGVTPV
jgi:hypothetical protein